MSTAQDLTHYAQRFQSTALIAFSNFYNAVTVKVQQTLVSLKQPASCNSYQVVKLLTLICCVIPWPYPTQTVLLHSAVLFLKCTAVTVECDIKKNVIARKHILHSLFLHIKLPKHLNHQEAHSPSGISKAKIRNLLAHSAGSNITGSGGPGPNTHIRKEASSPTNDEFYTQATIRDKAMIIRLPIMPNKLARCAVAPLVPA